MTEGKKPKRLLEEHARWARLDAQYDREIAEANARLRAQGRDPLRVPIRERMKLYGVKSYNPQEVHRQLQRFILEELDPQAYREGIKTYANTPMDDWPDYLITLARRYRSQSR